MQRRCSICVSGKRGTRTMHGYHHILLAFYQPHVPPSSLPVFVPRHDSIWSRKVAPYDTQVLEGLETLVVPLKSRHVVPLVPCQCFSMPVCHIITLAHQVGPGPPHEQRQSMSCYACLNSTNPADRFKAWNIRACMHRFIHV